LLGGCRLFFQATCGVRSGERVFKLPVPYLYELGLKVTRADGDEEDGWKGVCDECGAGTIRTSGDVVCPQCGLVHRETVIDPGPEWTAYTREERDRRRRTGLPSTNLIADKGLSTTIKKRDLQRVRPEARRKLARMRTWDERLKKGKADRCTEKGVLELAKMGGALEVGRRVLELSAALYRKAYEAGITWGRTRDAVAAACLLSACRKLRVSRSISEVSAKSGVKKGEILRCLKALLKDAGVESRADTALDLVPRLVGELGLSERHESSVGTIIRELMRRGQAAGKDPRGVCAGAIYEVAKRAGVTVTQAQAADVCGVTEVTIRKRSREIRRALGDLY
jgi:transcription initiation factor TFIIB